MYINISIFKTILNSCNFLLHVCESWGKSLIGLIFVQSHESSTYLRVCPTSELDFYLSQNHLGNSRVKMKITCTKFMCIYINIYIYFNRKEKAPPEAINFQFDAHLDATLRWVKVIKEKYHTL